MIEIEYLIDENFPYCFSVWKDNNQFDIKYDDPDENI